MPKVDGSAGVPWSFPGSFMSRPNIVWLCADDFNPSMCGAYGNRIVQTPELDRLAREGIRFDRAFCTCPLSTPSRQSFWTGRYPRSIGVTLSPTPLPPNEVTLPVLLRNAGYEVAAFGKTHFYQPRRHEFDLSVDWPDYQYWLSEQFRPEPSTLGKVLGPWRPFLDPASVWLNSDCLPYGAIDAQMFGTFLAEEAAEYLQEPKEKPFFLYVSFYETHAPFAFPVEFAGRHTGDEFALPTSGERGLDQNQIPPVFWNLTEGQKQGILAAYATSTEFLDSNVGLVLDALDESPHADNTLVIFNSDHGYLLGHHGRFEKHCCFEPAVRTALMMRQPGVIPAGRTTSALVELIDLVPTVLELAGISIPRNVQGLTLKSLIEGKTNRHRGRVIAEYSGNDEAMLRTERWKLIYSLGQRRRMDGYELDLPRTSPVIQLYDLESDPEELHNLARSTEQAARVEGMIAELAEHLVRTERYPERIPAGGGLQAILEGCLPPCDRLVYDEL